MTLFRWFISQTVRNACAVRKHYRRLLAAQRDLLSTEAIVAVQTKLDELTIAIREGHTGRINIKGEELQFAGEKWIKPYPNAAWRENVEVLLVALAVAMGIRTFFLQPFKIPTGSMQPTLFGVNSMPDFTSLVSQVDYIKNHNTSLTDADQSRLKDVFNRVQKKQTEMTVPTGFGLVKAWLHGDSYLHFIAPTDGKIEAVFPPKKFLIFNLYQSITFAGKNHTFWFPPDMGESDLVHRAGLLSDRLYHRGEDVVNLRVSAGDHLFVDRLTYNFCRPSRGDIIVFETAGIPEEMRDKYLDGNGNPIPDNEFYIKRLVGLPGEKVQIGDDRHLIINGKRLDASTPHFQNLYGFNPDQPPRDSQWSGHVNGTIAAQNNILGLSNMQFFPDQQAVLDVPTNSCLPMGDNTCNSLDSRFWGPIPESYVIGKSFFVYWPLTSRFGLNND